MTTPRTLPGLLVLFLLAAPGYTAQPKADCPNVILIMTDDQGYGDLGYHGNPVIRTPNLDKFARQSVRLEHFYVCPVCSPTRSSLLTGRYNYRTGVVDTYLGRSMMHPDEVTLAELLGRAGYATGIFGKWHLGDNYPLRPTDQGFQEALVHTGGGIGQPADPPGNSYFNPVLRKNNKSVRYKGYCTDIFTDAAIDFVTRHRDGPFFAYIPYNAPHAPLQVPDRYYGMYKDLDLSKDAFPKTGFPIQGKIDQEETARVYGMVTNIDDNLGRLFAALDRLKLADNTIVIFLTDNGPQQVRYNGGLRGRKGTVYEGGVRVPCFMRWPGGLPADRDVETAAAHIDIVPTVLDACNVRRPEKLHFDGRSLLPLLRGEKTDWPDRTLYFQWHRGDAPELYRAFAARGPRYRLVQPQGAGGQKMPKDVTFQLFDIQADPFEQHDIAAQHPDIVATMKKGYEEWFRDVSGTRGYDPPRIHLGAKQQPEVILTRQDWRGSRADWGPRGLGHWEVQVAENAPYEVTLQFPPAKEARTATVTCGDATKTIHVPPATGEVTTTLNLDAGPARLEAAVGSGEQATGVHYVVVRSAQE